MAAQLSAAEVSACDLVDQVEAIVAGLTARNAKLELQLARRTTEAADLGRACRELQSAAASDAQSNMQQLLAADQRANAQLQEQYAKALSELSAAHANISRLKTDLTTAHADLSAARGAAAAEQEALQGEASAQTAATAARLRDLQRENEARASRLQAEIDRLKTSQEEAATGSNRQVEALQAEKQQLLLTLDKERRANALASAARSDAGWKAKLMSLKTELERVKAERDKYKKLCRAQ